MKQRDGGIELLDSPSTLSSNGEGHRGFSQLQTVECSYQVYDSLEGAGDAATASLFEAPYPADAHQRDASCDKGRQRRNWVTAGRCEAPPKCGRPLQTSAPSAVWTSAQLFVSPTSSTVLSRAMHVCGVASAEGAALQTPAVS